MAQVVTDFFDELKSRSKGYASMEYSITGYRKNDLVRLDIKINNEVCSTAATRTRRVADACLHSQPVSASRASERRSRLLCKPSLDKSGALQSSADRAAGCPARPGGGPAGIDRAPGRGVPRGPRPGEEAQGAHPAPAVPDPDPGGHRLARHRVRGHLRCAPVAWAWPGVGLDGARREGGAGQAQARREFHFALSGRFLRRLASSLTVMCHAWQRCARTCWPSATAATSRARRSS